MMRQKTKRALIMLMSVMTTFLANAETIVVVNGLEYLLTGSYASVYGVAEGNTNQMIEIPATFNYNGYSYTVNELTSACFCNYYEDSRGYRHIWIDGESSDTDYYCSYTRGALSDAGRRSYNASFLRSIVLPSTIKTIGEYAFSNPNIISVNLNEGLESIGLRSFSYSKITSIIIPSSLQSFSYNSHTFWKCDMLRCIFYLGNTAPLYWTATSQTYVPSKEAYGSPKYSINNASIIEMITFSESTFPYTGKAPTPTYTNNIEGYSVSMEMSTLKSEVGTYEEVLPATFTKGDESFTAYIPYHYTIKPAKLTAKVNSTSRIYGELNPEFNITYTGFVNGENESVLTTKPSLATTANKNSAVGTYPITISGGTAKNYILEYEQGELTVYKASLGIQVMDASKVYGSKNPSFTLNYFGLKNEENVPAWITAPMFNTTATKESGAGVYEVTVTCEPKNYEIISNTPGKLTIEKALLTIKANDATMDYCGTMPTYDYTYSGFKNGDTENVLITKPTIATEATAYSNAGDYTITPEGAEADNYDFTYKAGILTIKQRLLTVRANSTSRLYGEENPIFTIEYIGFVNEETKSVLDVEPIVSTGATIQSMTGSYILSVNGGQAKNYSFTYQNGLLTITPRQLKAFVGNHVRPYGENNPAFTIGYEGFVLNDTEYSLTTRPTAHTYATMTSNVGTYDIKVYGGYSPNYIFTYESGTLTIVKAEQTFVWDQDLSNLMVGDQVELLAYASSGLPITYTMDSDDYAEIYKAGSKTYMECKKAGSFHIKAVQEGNKNYYSTQRINKSVTIVDEDGNGIETILGEKVKVVSTTDGIIITGVCSNELISVYTINGTLQQTVRADGSHVIIPLRKDNVYIVKIGTKTFKLRL